jgi:hypothetical protein
MRHWLASALLVLTGFVDAQLPLLETEWNALDGDQHDVAGPSLAVDSLSPELLRFFLANGRRRAAHEIASRERQFLGEETFDSTLNAVELDEENDLLLSLTSRVKPEFPAGPPIAPVLRVDDAGDPGAPFPQGEVEIWESPGEPEGISSMRIIPSLKRVVMVHPHKQVGGTIVEPAGFDLYDYDPQSSTFLQPGPFTPMPPIPSPCDPTKILQRLGSCEVAEIGAKRIAFFLAPIEHSGARAKPQSFGIVAADITNLAAPSFYTDALHVYDPVEMHFDCVSVDPLDPDALHGDRGVIDFAHKQAGANHFLFIAGGAELQFRCINVTNFDASGFVDVPTCALQLDVSACTGGNPGFEPLTCVAADPVLQRAYLTGLQFAYTVDLTNPLNPIYACDKANFGKGYAGDVLLLSEGPDAAPTKELWTVSREHSDYKWKITDVTSGPPVVSESHYAAGGIDGITGVPAWDAVYVLTFGGVVRFDVSGSGDPRPVDSSYKPAVDLSTDTAYATEELELGYVLTAEANKNTLLAPSAQGGFTAWPVDDGAPHDPLDPIYVDGSGTFSAPSPGDFTYGGDIGFWHDAVGGGDYALIDSYNATQDVIEINRYEFKPGTSGYWESAADGEWGTALTLSAPGIEVPVIDITIDGDYAFVTARGGFFVVDLAAWALVDFQLTSTIAGFSFQDAEGIARWDDRLFVSLSGVPNLAISSRIAILMYDFDELTGQVGALLQVLFDDLGGQDDFPDIYVTGGGRVRLHEELDGDVRVYSTTDSGHLLELEYEPFYDSLNVLAYWHDGSFYNELSDSFIYRLCFQPAGMAGFAPLGEGDHGGGSPNCEYRVLVPRFYEGWASVVPTNTPY